MRPVLTWKNYIATTVINLFVASMEILLMIFPKNLTFTKQISRKVLLSKSPSKRDSFENTTYLRLCKNSSVQQSQTT